MIRSPALPTENPLTQANNTFTPDELLARAESIIDRVVRPLILADGGEIQVVVRNNNVAIRLQGACSGCPGRPFTISRLIAPALEQELGFAIAVETF